METYLSRDTDTNIDLKRQIAYMKAVPESYIEILGIEEDKNGEYGSINVKYSYGGEEHTVSVLRSILNTIFMYSPSGGRTYESEYSIFSDMDLNSWTKDKHLKFVCDQLDIPSSEVYLEDISISLNYYNDIVVGAIIAANENSRYTCGKLYTRTVYYTENYINAYTENIKELLPKTFRHDYVEEYIRLYNDYPGDIPSEKLLELENKKIQEAGRESFFVKIPGYTYDPINTYYEDDLKIRIGAILEKYLLGTSSGRNIYSIGSARSWGSYKWDAKHCLIAGLRTDGGSENVFGMFSTRKLDVTRDLVQVMPKRGYTRNSTTNKSIYLSNRNNSNYYIESIKHIEGSKFKLRSDPHSDTVIYYSGIKLKDSYTDSELEEFKNSIIAGIEDQLYNVYNLPKSIAYIPFNSGLNARYNDSVELSVNYNSIMMKPGIFTIKIIYEK